MISILVTLEYISAITGTIFYKKFSSKFTAILLAYLWMICLTETLSSEVSKYGFTVNALYTLYTFFEFNLLFLMYLTLTKVKTNQKLIKFFILITNTVFAFEIFKQGINNWPSITTVVGSVLISVILILYLKEFLYSDKILNYSRSLYFWVTLGSLVYYLGSIPFQAIINYLENRDLYFLQISLAIFAQSCVIIGFLWSKKEIK